MSISEIVMDFELSLSQIISIHASLYHQARLIIALCRKTLKKLKSEVAGRDFKSREDEIYFFKKQKQSPLSNLIYYSSILDFENQFPRTGFKFQEKYIQESLKLTNRFFFKNKDFIEYIKSEQTNLDELYFTRDSFRNRKEVCCETFYRDDSFCTHKDLVLAQYTSNNRLITYINNRHHQLKTMDKGNTTPSELNSSINWTCSKTDLTELIYALHSRSAFNNGNIEIKEIAKTFENILHFKLDDFYKTYSEIKNRKKSQTKFLDDLSQSLITQINKSEI